MAQNSFRFSLGYLFSIGFIFVITAAGWIFLGDVTQHRTEKKDRALRHAVGDLWGGKHVQFSPVASLGTDAPVGPTQTRATARINLQHRQKGLLWYNTYSVGFRATYRFQNTHQHAREATLAVPLPSASAIYDDFSVTVDGKPLQLVFGKALGRRAAIGKIKLNAGEIIQVAVAYQSRGMGSWSYSFPGNTGRWRDFELEIATDFDDPDFPNGSVSPTHKIRTDSGWNLTWRFANLLTDATLAVQLPQKLNPGPLAASLSRFAPLSLLFFFGVLLLVVMVKKVRLHPIHFALLAGSFFSFHLLFAYLVGHVSAVTAFGISALASVGLVVSYLRLVVGSRFALVWAGGAQFLYLVLFSLAFFWEGYTGLTITVFSVLTLFLVMQLTAKIDWFTLLSKAAPKIPAPDAGASGNRTVLASPPVSPLNPAQAFEQIS